jgi:hypothetical protein
MRLLKKDSPPEIVKAIDDIETRADNCFNSLSLLNHPSNEAVWALLNRAIVMIEDAAQTQGQYSQAVSAVLQNVGRFAPIAIKWMLKHARLAASPFRPTWTNDLASDAQQALDVTTHYSHFETCYPMWHRDSLFGGASFAGGCPILSTRQQSQSPSKCSYERFPAQGGPFQGYPPKEPEQSKIVQAVFELALHGARMTGFTSFNYEDSWTLWRELLPEYRNRVCGIARRSDMLSLGHYTLAEFKEFYAGLVAIAAAHDHLCFRWQRERGVYPVASAAVVVTSQNPQALSRRISLRTMGAGCPPIML